MATLQITSTDSFEALSDQLDGMIEIAADDGDKAAEALAMAAAAAISNTWSESGEVFTVTFDAKHVETVKTAIENLVDNEDCAAEDFEWIA